MNNTPTCRKCGLDLILDNNGTLISKWGKHYELTFKNTPQYICKCDEATNEIIYAAYIAQFIQDITIILHDQKKLNLITIDMKPIFKYIKDKNERQIFINQLRNNKIIFHNYNHNIYSISDITLIQLNRYKNKEMSKTQLQLAARSGNIDSTDLEIIKNVISEKDK